jgi:molecular chaperone Hsp33
MTDSVLPFAVKALGIRGRIVRLGPLIDDILGRHDYPAAVSALLAQSVAMTSLLGTALKFNGKFIMQTKTDGPVSLLVADFVSPGGLRGVAKHDKSRMVQATDEKALLGTGYLAMTVDQGQDMERYQGIVPLNQNTLAEAAHTYFQQSEQIPTQLRLAAGPLRMRGEKGEHWRTGAILIQHLPREGGIADIPFPAGDAPEGDEPPPEPDDWVKAKLLLATVEDHELLDPALSSEDLLYRLYHEDGVTVYPAIPLQRHCTCSKEAVGAMLQGFTADERRDMVENGQIEVTCEFCSTPYRFETDDFKTNG